MLSFGLLVEGQCWPLRGRNITLRSRGIGAVSCTVAQPRLDDIAMTSVARVGPRVSGRRLALESNGCEKDGSPSKQLLHSTLAVPNQRSL